ncbi:hypothetical protein BU23DRAFT_491637 [Bimuria novae-zelandiae CBS 107.79]|uniref:Peptidase S28 n=1 Tax=Bimuria novae-zelandiae CBS 107.79 TaxID=1447943 RepID=A0A6A5UK90_9PLEO|nr:hypothetical protein BU23DRAFT_491637 [Bimuria novae-zelandiae CBS 107.79]
MLCGWGDARRVPLQSRQEAETEYPAHTIQQPIDHLHTPRYAPYTNATFTQRYFFDSSYYKPGGPVYLYIGGETRGESRFSNLRNGLIKILMEATGGLGVILENRYYGKSWPVEESTTDGLRWLTTEQTIADNVYFAQHATFPGVNATGSLNAPHTPWIMYGGSLAGGQVAFTMKMYNELFAGGIAASAPVFAKWEYPEWYDPILKYGPSDCISRLVGIIDKIDAVITSGDETAIHEVKEVFGLGAVSDIRDFAQAISYPLGGPFDYPTPTWQELNWNPPDSSQDFFHFCANITSPSTPSTTFIDTRLSKYTQGTPWVGLGAYAAYIKRVIVPLCVSGRLDSTDAGCFSTHNATYWSDPTNSGGRSYLYTSCTELGAFIAAPASGPSLISRTLNGSYMQSWCNQAFPPSSSLNHSIPAHPDTTELIKYGGYTFEAPKLAFIDGEADVWVGLTVHGGSGVMVSEAKYLIPGGGHHWDSSPRTGVGSVEEEPDLIREAHGWEVRTVRRWVEGFSEGRGGGK